MKKMILLTSRLLQINEFREDKFSRAFIISRWGTVPTATIGFGIFRGSPIADLRCTQIAIMTRHVFKEN
jgi:hypothetical protein